jgi:endonuclease/exonuclease/phosphatase family metal-dependent hydrolase
LHPKEVMTPTELRICTYNLENLFLGMEYYNGEDLSAVTEEQWRGFALAQFRRRQKPLFKLRGLAKAIRDIDPDVLMGVEVGGRESLENFNRYFLDEAYVPHFVETNSDRGIDLAYLVRKGLPDQFETRSNREMPLEVESYLRTYKARFARGVAELCMSRDGDLKMIFLLVHLKSKISSDQDYQGTDLRTAEARALARLYQSRREESPDVPIVIGGDFNAPLSSAEFDELRATDIQDSLELLGHPSVERTTLVFFDYLKRAHAETLDYLLVSPHLQDRIVPDKTGVYRYKTFYDIPLELPEELKEKRLQPSDHLPVVLTVRMEQSPR